jgi:hypothetical protein
MQQQQQQQQQAQPKLNKGFRLLERQLIPQGTLVAVAKFVWGTIWRLMMAELAPRDPTGAYVSIDDHQSLAHTQFSSMQYHCFLTHIEEQSTCEAESFIQSVLNALDAHM